MRKECCKEIPALKDTVVALTIDKSGKHEKYAKPFKICRAVCLRIKLVKHYDDLARLAASC